MYFTKQDYEKILGYILDHSKRDSEFETTYTIDGTELLSLVQNGVNKNVELGELLRLFDEHGLEVKISQVEGDSMTMVMSQRTVTDALNDIRDIIDLDAEKGTVQQQIDDINEHIGGTSSESIQSQIDSINEHIGGPSQQSIQSQIDTINNTIGPVTGTVKENIDDLNSRKLERGLESSGGDIVNNLTSSSTAKVLAANQGKILQDNIDSIQETVDTFVHSTITDRGMAVSVSGQTLNLQFTASDLDTVYVQQVGDVLSLTNATLS